MSDYIQVHSAIHKLSNKKRAMGSARFFKTGHGQYGEGDIFIGLTVPQCRLISQGYKTISLPTIKKLLSSKIHEERLIALLILVDQFNRGSEQEKKNIYNFYISNTQYINNWDLVDTSADKIVGEFLYTRSSSILQKFAKSKNLWERRIAIIATFAFIKKGDHTLTFTITKILLHDTHDLIHKACGWMLREVGKRVSKKELIVFLNQYSKTMPRTMLRYAIEHFSNIERKKFLDKKNLSVV
jgi:3-methyladenine DNA glycosylase AlkD